MSFSTNREWTAASSDSWCKVSPSSGTASETGVTISILCDPNVTYDSRSATVTIRVEDLTEIITVKQETNLGLLVSPTSYDLTNAAQTIEIEVRANVKYLVEIDAACKDWISQTGTKALSTEKITFSIAANDSYDNREGKIIIKQTDGNLSEIIVIKQSQTNGLFITTPEYDLSNEEHTLSIEVKANVSFQVSPQVDWIKHVETKALTSSTIVLSIAANKTYDDRAGTVLVKQTNGDLSGTITINQKQTDGLFVTPTDVDVDNAEHSVELEVKNNVSFDVVIPDEAKEWISINSNMSTKALAENKVILTIAKNESFDNREASVTIKQIDGPLAETVKIKQAQTDGLFITTPEYNVSNDSHTLSVEVQANVSFEVTPEAEWIHYVQTRALNSSTITLTIDANNTYDARTGKVSVKQSNGDLTDEITVNQAEKYGLFVSPEEFNLTKDEQSVAVEVKYNVEYDVVVPDAAKDWVSIQTAPITRGLTTESVKFAIAENTTYVNRETAIAFKQKGGDLTGTVKISQNQTDYLSITPLKDTVSCDGGSIDLSVTANIDYSLAIADNADWVTIGDASIEGSDKGLTTYHFSIRATESKEIFSKTATINIIDARGNTLQSFVLYQEPQPVIVFADDLIKEQLVKHFDYNGDGEITYKEAQSVESIAGVFVFNWGTRPYKSFDEFVHFTGVKTLPRDCFHNCSEMISITFPKGLETIEESALSGCSSLQSITLPESLLSLGYGAFSGCSALQSITLPNSLNTIGGCCFMECTNLTQLEFPDAISVIPGQVCQDCIRLTSVLIPEGVSIIEVSAFSGCIKLEDINLPSSLTKLDNLAFSECKKLHRVIIPNGVKEIPHGLFSDCSRLQEVVVPNGITSLGSYAFYECSSLKELFLPNSISTIGEKAFCGCTQLSSINLPQSLERIPQEMFYGCYSLKDISIPDGVIEIEDEAFQGCHSLNTITIPANVNNIGYYAFSNCNGLGKIISYPVAPPKCEGKEDDGHMFDNTNNCPIYVPMNSVEAYKIAEYWSEYSGRIQPILPDAVDLGLSVKWASFNLGASRPHEFGNYYAWGEILPKETYEWSTYKWCNGSKKTLNKYNTNVDYGVVDNRIILEAEDDAACVYLQGRWRMPTIEELMELMDDDNCKWQFTTYNGVQGYLVTSRLPGYLENSIFLPAGKYRGEDSSGLGTTPIGAYWTSSLDKGTPFRACDFYMTDYNACYNNSDKRYVGLSIRPVWSDK